MLSKSLKLLVVAAALALVVTPAASQTLSTTSSSAGTVGGVAQPGGPIATSVIIPPAGKIVTVDSGGNATVSGGSILGEAIMWAALLVGGGLAALIARWVQVGAKKLGLDMNDDARARLQEIVEHGIALSAQKAQVDLSDKLPLNVKAGVAVNALQYVQAHGADTLKQLGVDPNDPTAIEAVQARIAKAMNDALPPPTA